MVVGANDADESLLKYWRDQGFYHFREGSDGALALERVDYRPSPFRQLVRRSALARYALMNGRSVFRGRVGAVSGNTPTQPDLQRVRDSKRAVDTFLAQLPSMAGLAPLRIALVVDAIRPALYSPRERDAADSTFSGQVRRYLLERGREAGFEVVDMEPIFAAHFARNSVRFEYPVDAHWNDVGHRVAAEAVSASSVFRDLQGLP